MSRSHPIPLAGRTEQDALSGWRKVMRWRPGQRKGAKKTYNRRARRAWKEER